MANHEAVRAAAERYCELRNAAGGRKWRVEACMGLRLRGWLRIIADTRVEYYVGLSSGGVYQSRGRGQTYGNRICSIWMLGEEGTP